MKPTIGDVASRMGPMAKLTTTARNRLPKSDFALPGKGEGPKGKGSGSYPIPDRSHAANALARVAQHGTPAEKAKVSAAVHEKFPEVGAKKKRGLPYKDWRK